MAGAYLRSMEAKLLMCVAYPLYDRRASYRYYSNFRKLDAFDMTEYSLHWFNER